MYLPLAMRRRHAAAVLALVALSFLVGLTGKAAASAPHDMSLSQAPVGLQAAVHRTLAPRLGFSPAFQEGKLTASDGAAGDFFGYSVAINGSTAVVGAYVKNSNTGAAYVYVRSGTTWSQQQELTASDGQTGDDFGNSVAISGSTIVVGAPGHNPDTGAAYVFVRSGTTWSQQQELTAGRGGAFGASVAVSGSTALIGARLASEAYVYVRSGITWSEQAALTPSTGGGQFGYSVALSGTTAVVGAPFQNSDAGAAYVFVQSGTTWPQQAKLTASDAAAGDDFGWSVGVSGSTAVVGAPDKSSNKGAAYVFARPGTAWSQQAKLSAGVGGDFYGTSVATNGSLAVVGAPGNSGTGAAYVYARSGTNWPGLAKLTAADGAAGDQFGQSVSVSGSTAIVGAPANNSQQGAAYAFVLPSQTELTAGGEVGMSVSVYGSTAVVGAPNSQNHMPGAAYVYVNSGSAWSQQAKLTASDGTADDRFGFSVSLYGSTAIVGAIGQSSNAGEAYVFVRSGSTWSQQAKLTDPEAVAGDRFGYSVSLYASTAVISAFAADSKAGAAYVFARSGSTWSQQAKLTASDSATGDYFGYSVGIYGSTVIVGASGKSSNTGAAYVFVHSASGWSQTQKLTASGGLPGDAFGNAVAIYGSTAVIGAPGRASDTGAAYVFTNSAGAWGQQAKLVASDATTNSLFGFSVTIYGTTAIIGAPGASSPGAAYVFVPSPSAPQPWSQEAKLTASDGATGDGFGYSASLYGSTVFLGAPSNDMDTGAAYVFVSSGSTWSQHDKLTASLSFGSSVAISGSTALIAAPGTNANTGAAYVFVHGTASWSLQAVLTASGGATGASFGDAVALDGSTAVIGAPGANADAGAAYVFVRSGTTWSQQAKLVASDGVAGDNFGSSVALSGATAVIGAPGKSSLTGAAYVFVDSGGTWSQTRELTPSDSSVGEDFGNSVALSGGTAVVGAFEKNSNTGAAYVFVGSGTTWSQRAKLTASDAAAGDGLGFSVALSGSSAIVSAPFKNSQTGAAYVFVRSGTVWSQQAKVTAADATAGDWFGTSVAISGSTVVVGADEKSSLAGAAYAFVRSGSLWSEAAKLTAADAAPGDSFGASAALDGSTALIGAPTKSASSGAAYVFANL